MEFQQNFMDSIGNHSQRLLDSDYVYQNSLEKVSIFMELEIKMVDAPANCFPAFYWESTGTHGGV